MCARWGAAPRYEDTLLQRIGMAVACLGAVAELAALWHGYDRINAHITATTGAALFALGTVVKKWRGPAWGGVVPTNPQGTGGTHVDR